MSLISEVTGYLADGAIRALDSYGSGFGTPENDPPPATPSTVIYEGGKVKLRYYAARGNVRHHTPLLLVYALIKRPFILDLQPGRSVIEVLVNQGFDVYLIDWIPPGPEDSWRGFDAYANRDVANAARVVRMHHGAGQVTVLGYCFGALLALIYTALHKEEVKNLITLTIPFDMSVKELPITHMMGVRGRPPDPPLLERLDQRGLGVAGRRLGKVLLGVERQELEHLALAERGHHGLLLLLGHRL